MKTLCTLCLLLVNICFSYFASYAEESRAPLRLGFIGSLTSFAGNYGTAVLRGAQLAIAELKEDGINIQLIVEDDQSDARHAASAYSKLSAVDHIQGLIGGSWWINAVVRPSERDGIPIISCETLFNGDHVPGKNYFLLQGDLRDWVRAYEPTFRKLRSKRGAIIHFASGFGTTLASEVKAHFSSPGREFVGELEYSDIQASNAAALVLQLKKFQPDSVYIDAQPAGYASILRRMQEIGLQDIAIFGHSSLTDAVQQKLVDLSKFSKIYTSRRSTFDPDFEKRFEAKYKERPMLNADLGYYAVYLMAKALIQKDPIATLKQGLQVGSKKFDFDSNNVHTAAPQEVWKLTNQSAILASQSNL